MRTLLVFLFLTMTAFSDQIGIASHYSVRTNGGTHTTSGEMLRDNKFTAAHRKFKMGTLVRVTNLRNNRVVVLRINDRGPYKAGRIIDVSQAAAKALGFHKNGLTKVHVKAINPPKAIPVKETWLMRLKTRIQSLHEKRN